MASSRPALALALASFASLLAACAASVPRVRSAALVEGRIGEIGHLEPLGEAAVPSSWSGSESPVGGLSALVRDPESGDYLALSDDRAERGPARYYTLRIDLTDGRLDEGDVQVTGESELRLADGAPFGRGRVDPEGLALLPSGELMMSSEGVVREEIRPFVRIFGEDGVARRDVRLPPRYLTRRDGQAGVRDNLGFEALSLSPSGRLAFTAVESALIEDAPPPSHDRHSPARLLIIDVASGTVVAEHVYPVEPLQAPDDGRSVNGSGLVELLALSEHRLLALERAFAMGRGNRVRLYEIELTDATDVLSRSSLADAQDVRPLEKRLVLDVGLLGIRPDNLEGMALGPHLADGRPTLLLLADDNFAPRRQRSQLLAFAVGGESPAIHDLQGPGHRSPWEGRWVGGVEGVVTAVDRSPQGRPEGFWMQGAADGDPRTSEGVRVDWQGAVAEGDAVRVAAGVRELRAEGELPETRLAAGAVTVVGRRALPAPVRVTSMPERIDDDGLQAFEPEGDAIDFLESLEGMRLELADARVVGPTTSYGELAVVSGEVEPDALATDTGGILAAPEDPHPERWLLGASRAWPAPQLAVGARFTAPVVGVLGYGFGAYRLEVDAWPPAVERALPEPMPFAEREGSLTVATYNVYNLDPTDPPVRFERLAEHVVEIMGSPDVLALQEVQDDDGPAEGGAGPSSGPAAAGRTLGLLTAAIARQGGPVYAVRQIDPEPGAEGGEPGGNIRVVFLVRPDRVRIVDRGGAAGPRDATSWVRRADGVGLSLSPGRVAPDHPAFAGDAGRGWSGTRPCLALELEAGGPRPLFVVNCHLSSKGADDRLFGARQPPERVSEARRSAQTEVVATFARELLGAVPDAALIVLGDLNENEFREPIERLEAAGLVDLVRRVPEGERYTFIYRGLSQVLDHVLVSPALAAGAEARILHLNADRPDSLRASDHDPVVARLAWPSGPEGAER